jgi:arylsulfatase A-like enzyme
MVEALRLTKALGRTVIVFTSDNGALEGTRVTGGMHANGPLAGGKTLTTDGGTRVPAFVYYPRMVAARWSDALAHVTDLLPTFLAIAGARETVARVGNRPFDGVDLWPMLTDGSGRTASPRTEMLYNLNPRKSSRGLTPL